MFLTYADLLKFKKLVLVVNPQTVVTQTTGAVLKSSFKIIVKLTLMSITHNVSFNHLDDDNQPAERG